MLLSWVAYPLLVVAASFGCGLLVERIGGWRMPGVVVAGVGLATVIVVAALVTESFALAPWTQWFVVALAVAGYAVSVSRLRALRPDWWQVALGLLLFAAYAAPIVLSGHPTFSGYNVDGDPAFHMATTLLLLAHGHLPSSQLAKPPTYSTQLTYQYLLTDYPFGADLAAGVFRSLTDVEFAWIYAPFMAVVLTLGGLTIYELLQDIVESRALRALCAFIAAQAGLAYSFYLISSIKELTTTWAITLLVVLLVTLVRRGPSVRALAPVAVVTAAAIDILAIPAVPWLAPPLGVFAIVCLWRERKRLRHPTREVGVTGAWTALAIVITALLAWPILKHAATSLNTTTAALGTGGSGGSALGELVAPLNPWQVLGIWPNGDFRDPLALHVTLVHVLIYLAAASAVGGAVWAAYRRYWGLVVLLIGNGIVAFVLYHRSVPYGQAKVLAILSITAVLAAMLGAVALHDVVSPKLGWVLAAVLALAVLWTNDKSFREAPLAPQPRFASLLKIDDRFAGQGPTFYNLWDEEFPLYLLRRVNVTDPGIYAEPTTRPGTNFPASANAHEIPWDPNDLTLAYLESFKLLVIGRSPTTARPPANFTLAYQDAYYDVYRRQDATKVLAHASVTGGLLHNTVPLSCRHITRLGARAARRHAHLAYTINPAVASVKAADSTHPATWEPLQAGNEPQPGALQLPTYGGTLTSKISVPRTGRYVVWLGGALSNKVSVSIGGTDVGSVAGLYGPGGMFTELGAVRLHAGAQPVVMHRAAASQLHPAGANDSLGSLVLTRTSGPAPVHTAAPSAAHTLCGRRLQWLEIVR